METNVNRDAWDHVSSRGNLTNRYARDHVHVSGCVLRNVRAIPSTLGSTTVAWDQEILPNKESTA